MSDKPGGDGRFILALDCFALVQGDWYPDANLKPGEKPDGDLDRAAAAQVFRFPAATAEARVELPLKGPWQVCRDDDPNMDATPYEPVKTLPMQPLWHGVNVPSGLRDTPALDLAHRVWYRCRVDVPAAMQGRGCFLDFTGTNWIASVVVNGRFVGSHKSTRVPWKIDLTSAVKPGQVNEILVGIKDLWYGIDAQYHKRDLNHSRNLPLAAFQWTYFVAPFYPSTKGDADGTVCGITDPVSLIVCGPTYVDDVFVQTSVRGKRITADVTVRNPSAQSASVEVAADALHVPDGQAEKTLPPVKVTVPAGGAQQVTLSADWPNPKLWWPDQDPAEMYRLRVALLDGKRVVDQVEQPFGFREVTIDGVHLQVNGLRRNFWNMLAGLEGATLEDRLTHFRAGNNRFERFSADLGLGAALGPRRAQLDWTDAHGIPGRLSTMIDGMFINYDLNNAVVWENFREHCEQVARAYRNHPSIMVYSLENELILINGRLRWGGNLDQIEQNARTMMVEPVRKLDPTRPAMLDGAGALADNSLDLNCLHYPEADNQFYPENFYALERYGDFGKRWAWDRKRPLALGETFFFAGKNSEQAWIGGDVAFRGREEATRAAAKYTRDLVEGYRWNDAAIICPWIGADRMPETRLSMSPLAAFLREHDLSSVGGEKGLRTVKVFNDTFSSDPVTFSWAVELDGKKVAGAEQTLKLEPGFSQELTIPVTGPAVKQRTSANLILRIAQAGKVGFEDTKAIAFFPTAPPLKVGRAVSVWASDPKLAGTLSAWGVKATAIAVPLQAPAGSLLVVGQDVLTEEQAKSTTLADFARAGGRVICLEQEHPLQGAALPVPLKATDRQAYFTFPQGLGTRLFEGLEMDDLSNWTWPGPTAKRVWEKPTGAARSWVECGNELTNSALVEVPCGNGVMLLSQLLIGTKMGAEPAARQLLADLIRYCDTYAPASAVAAVCAPDRPEIAAAVTALGCATKPVDSPAQALDYRATPVAIVSASAPNLKALAGQSAAAKAFTDAGGWIMLWGLEPDGLAALNNLLGTQHLLRPFRLEKVSLEPEATVAGLGNRDVVMYSDRELMFGDKWLSKDVFTYVVEGADIAPFCRLPGQKDEPYQPTYDDHDPYNLVNGMTNDDSWRYILQIWHKEWPPEGSPPFTFGLPEPVKVRRVRIWNNANYDTIRDLEVDIDGQKATMLELPDAAQMAEADLQGVPAGQSVSLVVRGIRTKAGVPLVGIDNVQIVRDLPDWYRGRVVPLVNCGGLVKYPRGKGGFILNQLKLTNDDLAENKAKKARIVATILQNLGVAFRQ